MRTLSLGVSMLVLLFVTSSCKQDPDVIQLPALAGNYLQAVIEIPAGTNHKIEYNAETGTFENDLIDGRIRVIDFLPYPGNYGFVPSTLMDEERGGDGDALDVLVLGEAQTTGTVLAVIPIGALQLRDQGEIDTKIIAVPADPNLQIIKAEDFVTFALRYDAARRMIEDWFQHYKGADAQVEVVRWEDESFAWEEVKKWTL